jgi:hypothetical protein
MKDEAKLLHLEKFSITNINIELSERNIFSTIIMNCGKNSKLELKDGLFLQ